MIIDCISDLHGYYPELEGGDLLIVAGDLTKKGQYYEYIDVCQWLEECEYDKKIIIAGNHDQDLTPNSATKYGFDFSGWATYLFDSGIEFKGLKIWGSPWTKTFEGMNPHCKAFTVDTDEELCDKWILIPKDTDILITHSPPYDILDKEKHGYLCGSNSLKEAIQYIQPKLHVFGHIHEAYGIQRPNLGFVDLDGYPIYVNASYVNERYQPVNKPVRIEL